MTGLAGVARGLLLAVLASLALSAATHARPLTFAFGDHNEAPFALVDGGQLKGGFALEFGRAIAARLGREVAFRFVPRNRITAEITAGSVDAYCLAAQPYYPTFAADRFTQALFSDQDIVLLSAGLRGPADMTSLVGARVGTVLGFLYPPVLEALFSTGGAERIDARNADGNLRKLLGGRLDAVILPLAAWRLALSRDPSLAGAVRPDFISVAVRERVCLVSPSSPVTVPEMNMAIQSLAADGTLPAMIRAMGLDLPGGQSASMPGPVPAPARR
ncbi:ABC transporter substrate-binding protein [Niveispirillum sp.]|uniref:substrate-binding periplasmic protein n=1 Tax=Niveispirillum sp. TaxID=1917217 RepID=UPI001B5BCBBA|nr:transporter substrate-binding domain-containing protein [Niveispirillum sp.]MBP7335173.1 transporter substrate-binding domain-containing protein [Niveispirillum sp.]